MIQIQAKPYFVQARIGACLFVRAPSSVNQLNRNAKRMPSATSSFGCKTAAASGGEQPVTNIWSFCTAFSMMLMWRAWLNNALSLSSPATDNLLKF